MTVMLPVMLLALFAASQAAPECKNCVMLGKDEKAMFRAHSDACLAASGAPRDAVLRLLRGEPLDEPALRRHVYCVLRRCKLIGKDGKLQKAAVMGKLARADARNATKVLESCGQQGDKPEDLAWSLFRCGLDRKAMLLHHLPNDTDDDM
ncbi:B1 protein-like [Bicyclus anynana]|uniref:B1 protein-like n=1 Tax=Bicyclus anynana TaxID=110368 RepID=A0A6J1MQW1_BICAN|nr:B1 protein-like [Bicyclus anynana]